LLRVDVLFSCHPVRSNNNFKMRRWTDLLLLFVLAFPCVVFVAQQGSIYVCAESDLEDDIVDVEGDDPPSGVLTGDDEEDEDQEGLIAPSPDAETVILFTQPQAAPGASNIELPAGQIVEFLVGFTNKGSKDFVLDTLDASFRYPMDYTFYIQNFSTIGYRRTVKPKQQATLLYSFIPSDTYAGRPFGLNVMLGYHDLEGHPYLEAVYNETVQIVELEEGLDGETFFLYVFLLAGLLLLLVLGHQGLSSLGKKGGRGRNRGGESIASAKGGVDYDWIPQETLRQFKKTGSPQQSPRQRKAKRNAGADN